MGPLGGPACDADGLSQRSLPGLLDLRPSPLRPALSGHDAPVASEAGISITGSGAAGACVVSLTTAFVSSRTRRA